MKHAAVLPLLRRLVDARPTYGYRRITALVKRQLAAEGAPRANHKRISRLMKVHGLLLEKHTGRRPNATKPLILRHIVRSLRIAV